MTTAEDFAMPWLNHQHSSRIIEQTLADLWLKDETKLEEKKPPFPQPKRSRCNPKPAALSAQTCNANLGNLSAKFDDIFDAEDDLKSVDDCPRSPTRCPGCGRLPAGLLLVSAQLANEDMLRHLPHVPNRYLHRRRKVFDPVQAAQPEAKMCIQCYCWMYHTHARPTVAEQTTSGWPSKVGWTLKNASESEKNAVWAILPPSLRWMWSGISDILEMEEPGMADCSENRQRIRCKVDFERQADLIPDTKCGSCRKCLVQGETSFLPLSAFVEGGLFLATGQTARTRKLAAGWIMPSDTVIGQMVTRAKVVDSKLQVAVCEFCAKHPETVPFLSVIWPKELLKT